MASASCREQRVGELGALAADRAARALCGDDAQGRYQGASGWARGLARFGALVLGPAVYAVFGPAALWWGCLVPGLAGAALMLLISGAVRTRTEATAG